MISARIAYVMVFTPKVYTLPEFSLVPLFDKNTLFDCAHCGGGVRTVALALWIGCPQTQDLKRSTTCGILKRPKLSTRIACRNCDCIIWIASIDTWFYHSLEEFHNLELLNRKPVFYKDVFRRSFGNETIIIYKIKLLFQYSWIWTIDPCLLSRLLWNTDPF